MEATKDLVLQQKFDKFCETSNIAYTVTLAASIGWGLALFFTWLTGANWSVPAGFVCFGVALPSAVAGFIAQTRAQATHWRRNTLAKKCGRKPIEFIQEKPSGAEFIAGMFGKASNITKAVMKPRTVSALIRPTVRNHARAHRSASRPMLSSNSSKGTSNDGNSGDPDSSDSGDEPPELTTPTAQSLYLLCTQKTHRNSVYQRVSPKHSMPNGACPDGRCPV